LQGLEYNSPFIAISNELGYNHKLIFPVKSLTGYADFRHIYNFNNHIYVSGVFTNKVFVANSEITSSGNWDAFLIKLDAQDSVEWIKIFNVNDINIAPEMCFYDGKLFVDVNIIDNDSSYNLIAEFQTDGSVNWERIFPSADKQSFLGLEYDNDTLNGYFNLQNQVTKVSLLNGNIVSKQSIGQVLGYNSCHGIFNNHPIWVHQVKEGELYNCELYYLNGNTLEVGTLFQSAYVGNVDVISADDTFVYLVGFFQGQFIYDSTSYLESDSSNSFIVKYNHRNKIVENFDMLPYKNICRSVLLDSTIYLISNYVDQNDNIKRSTNEFKSGIEDFRIHVIKFNLRKEETQITVYNESLKKLVVFPNLNPGQSFSICCGKQLIINSLKNSIGQEIPYKVILKGDILMLEPIERLAEGIYFVRISDSTSNEHIYKIIVKY
jgi:hypothetical protein